MGELVLVMKRMDEEVKGLVDAGKTLKVRGEGGRYFGGFIEMSLGIDKDKDFGWWL